GPQQVHPTRTYDRNEHVASGYRFRELLIKALACSKGIYVHKQTSLTKPRCQSIPHARRSEWIVLAPIADKYLPAHVTSPIWSGAPKCPITVPLSAPVETNVARMAPT